MLVIDVGVRVRVGYLHYQSYTERPFCECTKNKSGMCVRCIEIGDLGGNSQISKTHSPGFLVLSSLVKYSLLGSIPNGAGAMV